MCVCVCVCECVCKQDFEHKYHTLVNNTTPRRHRLLNENHSASYGLPLFELVPEAPEIPRQYRLLSFHASHYI